MNIHLSEKKCVACEGGVLPLTYDQTRAYTDEVPNWFSYFEDMKGKYMSLEFECKDFKGAIEFINKIAELAETEGHHPAFSLVGSKLLIRLSTYAIGGLSENDFIMASKIDKLAEVLGVKPMPIKVNPKS